MCFGSGFLVVTDFQLLHIHKHNTVYYAVGLHKLNMPRRNQSWLSMDIQNSAVDMI